MQGMTSRESLKSKDGGWKNGRFDTMIERLSRKKRRSMMPFKSSIFKKKFQRLNIGKPHTHVQLLGIERWLAGALLF